MPPDGIVVMKKRKNLVILMRIAMMFMRIMMMCVMIMILIHPSIVVFHKEKDKLNKSGNSGESAWFSALSNDD